MSHSFCFGELWEERYANVAVICWQILQRMAEVCRNGVKTHNVFLKQTSGHNFDFMNLPESTG